MTWSRGRATIERLLEDGELERVTPSPAVADRLLTDAAAHIALAEKGVDDAGPRDPAGALQLGYDAARKASAALLAVQGLRATTRGGHVAVLEAVRDQFAGPGVEVFGRTDRYRRRRHVSEYPDPGSPGVTVDDAVAAIEHARELLNAAGQLLDSGRLDPF